MDQSGNLYGTTMLGGAHHGGTIYEVTLNPSTQKWTHHVLYSFCSDKLCFDGKTPLAELTIDRAGNLYGVTNEGGISTDCGNKAGCGTAFELIRSRESAWSERVLYSFCSEGGCPIGFRPEAGLVMDRMGNLYGTTVGHANYVDAFEFGNFSKSLGNRNEAGGAVFELEFDLTKKRWNEKALLTFCPSNQCDNGWAPQSGLTIDASGSLYGTTLRGGRSGAGTAFELRPTGKTHWAERILQNFCAGSDICTKGSDPAVTLVSDEQGNLYGTSNDGGEDCDGTSKVTCGGGVFMLLPMRPAQMIYHFCQSPNCEDGFHPHGELVIDKHGDLYGTTRRGGASTACGDKRGCGTIFKLNYGAQWTEQVLHDFCSAGGKECTDGEFPVAGLIFGPSGKLYGTSRSGGMYDHGTIFELDP
jgi:uncharacterized repeat protein (TIGR03803 family)